MLLAGDAMMRAMDQMAEEFEHAALHDPTIAVRCPQIAAFLRVRKDSAARAAATRKKNNSNKAA